MDEIEELAEIFRALSDPTRLRLVGLLAKRGAPGRAEEVCSGGPPCVNALAHRRGVTQSAVSQHLRVLRHAGLVRGRRHGTFVHYALDADGLERYRAALVATLGEEFVPV